MPPEPFVGNSISSTLAAPPKWRVAREVPGNSSHPLSGSRKSASQRFATSQSPRKKSKSFTCGLPESFVRSSRC